MFLPGAQLVLSVLGWVFTVVGVFAFGHALIHRWVAITAASTAAIALFEAVSLPGIVGVVAVLVYLTDVRPKVTKTPHP